MLGTMVYCDKNFGPDGLAIVPTADGHWIVITVAVKSSSINTTHSTAAVGVGDVVMNCGTASLRNGYRRRPRAAGTGGAGGAGAGGAALIDKNAVPVVFDGYVDEEGVAAVGALVTSGRVAGFLRLQVVLPRSGDAKASAFKAVTAPGGSCASSLRRQAFLKQLWFP